MINNRRGSTKLKNNIKNFLVLIMIVALAGLAGYFWNEAQQAKMQNNQVTSERKNEEANQVITKLKAILLINDESEPTLARIDNPEKLKKDNLDFYKNAKKGDYIVVYKERAIIFRSVGNGKIINIAPIINTNNPKKSVSDKIESK